MYEISKEDFNEIGRIRTLSRAQPSDISSMKRIHDKYINNRLKKVIDWTCPSCVRDVINDLITYQSQAKIVDDEIKIDTSKQPSKSRKNDK